MNRINIYIDGNNLHRSAQWLGFKIDYKKFRGWLRQKYSPLHVYLFIGMIPERIKLYRDLQKYGYVLIFKQAVYFKNKVKGNCDTELVLKSVSDFYTNELDQAIVITGDGDFGCLIDFLKERNALHSVISPNQNTCSILIRNKNIEIIFLNNHYHKFSNLK